MTRQRTPSEIIKSISGGLLVGLGLHILLGNVDKVAAQLSQFSGFNAGESLGMLSSAVLAASQAGRAYAVDHLGVWQDVLKVMASLWPLLLVMVGVRLLRDVFTDKVEEAAPSTKYFQNKDVECRFCCPSFDA